MAGVERHLSASRRPRPRSPQPARTTHGSASTARSISAHSGPAPKRTGSSTGRPVSAAIRAISARASSSDGIDRRVQRDRDDLRRGDEPGDPLVEVDERAELGDRERRVRQVVEVVLGLAGLVDEDHRLGRRAVDQRERHRRVGRVVERALALDDHPVAAPLALLDHPFDGALGEVADQAVDGGAPALDHHPGLAGRDERGRSGRPHAPPCAAPARPTSCRSRSPSRRSGSPACPGRGGGRPPSPSGPAAGGSRRSGVPDAAAAAANSGSSPRNVWSPEWTSRPARIAARIVARQASGSLPPVGAIPIRSVSGARLERQRLVEGRDDRDVVVGQDRRDVAAGLGRVDDRDRRRRVRTG